ncbi:unnamed protein product [Ectocarpus sp. 6 AP-2014]
MMSDNQHHQRLSVCLMLMPILALSCGFQRGPGDSATFVAPSCPQRQRLLGRRACLSRGGCQGISQTRARCLAMDMQEGREGPENPPKNYRRNGKWTVYSSSGRGAPLQPRDPNQALSKKAQARRDKEYELGTKIQRMMKLLKLKDVLQPAAGEDEVSNEVWAEGAMESVENLRQALDEGEKAKQELVLDNLNLVDIIVKNYVGTFAYGRFTEKDLTQDATVGLIRAVEKFDPEKGFFFATYGRWWVRKYLHEGVQNHDRMVRIPNSAAYRIAKVKRVRDELEGELGRAPTKPEIALETDLTVQQVEACLEQQDSFRIERLDGYMGHGFGMADTVFASHFGEGFLYGSDMLTHPGETPAPTVEGEKVIQSSLRGDLSSAFVRLLDATERECLVLRYGLHDGVTNSIEQTAAIMDFCDPDDVRIITTQAMAKLRDGCLPEERKKLMSYLSVYEPSTPSYSKGKYDPSKSRRNKRLATDSRASTSGAISSSSSRVGDGGDDSTTANAAGAAVDGGDARTATERESSRRVVGDFSEIGKPGWMKPNGNESGSAGAGGAGAGSRFFRSKEEERRMWASRFSKMEQEHQRDDRARSRGVSGGRTVMGFNEVRDEKGEKQRREEEEERQLWGGGDRSGYPTTAAGRNTGDKQQQDRGVGVNGSSNGGGGGGGGGVDNYKGDERRPWDFSKHGQEELQHELTRYLRKHRLAKKNAEKAAALKAENPAAAAQAAGVAARTTRRRKPPPPTTAAPPAVVAAAGTNNPASSGRSTDGARAAAVAAVEAAAERRRKRASATGNAAAASGSSSSGSRTTRLMGHYGSSALDLAQQEREERRRERQAAEEEWEREQAVRPLPVGNGAGSVVIGDLEPVANSREADQLEHLSRLLWDGEEEPADFSLSYGKKPKRGGPLE